MAREEIKKLGRLDMADIELEESRKNAADKTKLIRSLQ